MSRDLIAIEMHRDKRKLPVERTGIRVRDPSIPYFEILAFPEKDSPLYTFTFRTLFPCRRIRGYPWHTQLYLRAKLNQLFIQSE